MCITAECPDPTEVGIWWRDDAAWKLYSRESMRAILRALVKGTPSLQLDLPIKTPSKQSPRSVTYLIDLSKMEQKNVATGHKREIKLVFPSSSACSYRHGKPSKDQQEWGRRTHDSTVPGKIPAVEGVVRLRMHDSCTLVIRIGNIVEWNVDGEADAVVNPCGAWRRSADRLLADATGGGSVSRHGGAGRPSVAAALHHAAGPKLQEAVQRSVRSASRSGREGGGAIVTPGFNLPASHVVHTFAAPVYEKNDEASSCAQLEKTYGSALTEAAVNGMQYVAFPAISCGAGGFPVEIAARVALQAVCNSSSGGIDAVMEIHFVFLEPEVWLEWIAQARKSFFKVA